ncbi:DUF3558 domain-containing protein [Umezawaea endophytica]|uniref:DUF3558 domain-containing protein n=1 Tax=Umezawaea endophytica TaxID=1654476 RepID=A0A9X2VRL1_9PSEU|nr:DUF3558 domain-containing protein [Umezawaea endophytica]MCS7480892.1 DUF3558 domain-containing protein [Umezawaea endophytica]
MSHWHRVAALAAAVALLAGCSQKTSGTASTGAAGSSGPTSATSKPSTSAKPSVERPKKVDLTGVDSCSVLTDAQKQQFDLTGKPGRLPYPTHPEATLCSIGSSDFSYGLAVAVITSEGIEMYAQGVESGKAATMVVGSFPAVLSEFPGALPACFVGLDVADGQLIEVQVDGSKLPMAELCARATNIADAVIQTISAR